MALQLSPFSGRLWLFSLRTTFFVSFSPLLCYHRASLFNKLALLSRCRRLLKFKVTLLTAKAIALHLTTENLLSTADVYVPQLICLKGCFCLSLFFPFTPNAVEKVTVEFACKMPYWSLFQHNFPKQLSCGMSWDCYLERLAAFITSCASGLVVGLGSESHSWNLEFVYAYLLNIVA